MLINKTLVVVLGMHRSGTSSFTRALKVMGVDLGDNLMPPIATVNDKGFYEDVDINKFNDYLLKKMGYIWCSHQIPQNNQLEFLNNQEDINSAIDLLKRKLNNVPIFGFKDPRVTVLLPFWQNIFKLCNLNVKYLIAIRNPLSVAQSLQKRDNFPLHKGLFLWTQYMLATLEFTQKENRVLVSYEELMHNPQLQIEKISNTFALPINLDELKIYTNEFLDSTLQHGNLGLEDLKKLGVNYNFIYDLYLFFLELLRSDSDLNLNLNSIIDQYNNEINLYLNDFNFQNYLIDKFNNLSDEFILLNKQLKYANYLLNERLNEINNLVKNNNDLLERIKSNANHIEYVEHNLKNIQNSFSMKITQPIRYLIKLFTK
jgi:hypothetical protein